ncbi:MAG: putative DNA modification/repair radical SAM protein, partial [Anaerovoracaceae bacterium]
AGYIHAKIIPGVSPELVHQIGLEADRLSVNAELPSRESLQLLAPQKTIQGIFSPMKQITNTLIEYKSLKGPGNMFKGKDLNQESNYLREQAQEYLPALGKRKKETFAPAGQTTQMMVGAGTETDRQIIKTGENLYRTFKMKRVYYSAYVPVVKSEILPDVFTAPPLAREHRLYQADWLLRFYGFSADELFAQGQANLDTEVDPKVSWALRHLSMFPMEINRASMEELLRIPGVGTLSALRIIRQRKLAAVGYEDLKKIGVVVKRARHFITCKGKYYGEGSFTPEKIRDQLLETRDGVQLSLFNQGMGKLSGGNKLNG